MFQLVWSHGWGFDATFFAPLCHALPEYEHFIIDWGYFNAPLLPKLDKARPLVGIGHSLGFAKLFDLPFSYEHVISLGGFTHFCPIDSLVFGTPSRVVQRMWSRLQTHPQQVLQDFYRSCGFDIASLMDFSHLNQEQLSADLNHLMRLNLTIDLSTLSYLALAAKDDRICTLPHQQAMFSSLHVMDGGHNFPVTHPQETACLIRQFLGEAAYAVCLS